MLGAWFLDGNSLFLESVPKLHADGIEPESKREQQLSQVTSTSAQSFGQYAYIPDQYSAEAYQLSQHPQYQTQPQPGIVPGQYSPSQSQYRYPQYSRHPRYAQYSPYPHYEMKNLGKLEKQSQEVKPISRRPSVQSAISPTSY